MTGSMQDGKRRAWLVAALLALAAIAAYAPVFRNEFIHIDDNTYITDNPWVLSGLSMENLRWAFTTTRGANWHPLTWISHQLDGQLFGGSPAGHRVQSLLFHVASALLLFRVLRRATGDLGPSAFVAALFALHPLHVESVAWAAERKDVLSAFFWMATLWAYVRWVERPSTSRYALALLAFVLGLLSKPMLVTMPFVLLLLDYWPLRRLSLAPAGRSAAWARVQEKLPFLALAIASSVVTFLVQRAEGAMVLEARLPLPVRVENALVAYATYLGQTIWPSGLLFFYPHPLGHRGALEVGIATLAVAGPTVLAILLAKSRPYVLVGWLWYLGTLVPVIGLLQVGAQSHADRYTYLPLVGFSIAVAWGARDLLARGRTGPVAGAAVAVLLCAAWIPATWHQVETWRSDETLFRREAAYLPEDPDAHRMLGLVHLRARRLDQAIAEYEITLRLKPRDALALGNYGMALELSGKRSEALSKYAESVASDPSLVESRVNLGRLLAQAGRTSEAIGHLEAAVRANPEHATAHANLGAALLAAGRVEEAIAHLERALVLEPGLAGAQRNLAAARAARGGASRK